jgi:hypothetical protein
VSRRQCQNRRPADYELTLHVSTIARPVYGQQLSELICPLKPFLSMETYRGCYQGCYQISGGLREPVPAKRERLPSRRDNRAPG